MGKYLRPLGQLPREPSLCLEYLPIVIFWDNNCLCEIATGHPEDLRFTQYMLVNDNH